MLVAETGIGTYRCSLSVVVILTGVPRRCCGANGPFTVSVDFQLSAPELAADPCRSATTSRLVIVAGCVVSTEAYPLPFETRVRGVRQLGGGEAMLSRVPLS